MVMVMQKRPRRRKSYERWERGEGDVLTCLLPGGICLTEIEL